jgi:hypothetical protein
MTGKNFPTIYSIAHAIHTTQEPINIVGRIRKFTHTGIIAAEKDRKIFC